MRNKKISYSVFSNNFLYFVFSCGSTVLGALHDSSQKTCRIDTISIPITDGEAEA